MPYLYQRNWSRSELMRRIGSIDQVAGIRLVEAADGMERGNRTFQVRTGTGLQFNVLAERCLDITSFSYKGIPLVWTAPVGEVHPAYYEPDGVGWLRSFAGGLLATCGLDQIGAPSEDAGEVFGLHGRVGHIPARAVAYRTSWVGDECDLEVTGEVRQARVFGENLVLQRRISTRIGSDQVFIEDKVTNEGFTDQPHLIMYHFNFGFPLLSETSRLHLETEHTEARDSDARSGLPVWREVQAPTPGYREQVFLHRPSSDGRGWAEAALENADLGITLRLRFEQRYLPYLTQWKMMGEGLYVLGLEPCNSSGIEGRGAARQRGDLPYLAPGESRTYVLEVAVTDHRNA